MLGLCEKGRGFFAQRDCEVSIIGDTKKLTEHGPGQLPWAGGWTWWPSEVPSSLAYSMFPWNVYGLKL